MTPAPFPRAPENPFHAGTIVTGDDFADRQEELALLRDELRQGGRVFLLAYRRFGKSCLRLCRGLWSRGVHARRLTEGDVRDAFSDLVAEGDQLFAEAWDALTLAQRRTLAAVAEGRGGDVFAERVRHAYELGPSSTVARSLARLQELSFVARERAQPRGGFRYRIVDPLLRAWVLRGRPPAAGGEARMHGGQESTPRRTRARRTTPRPRAG